MPSPHETIETVRVSSADLANLLRERDALRTQVTALQADASSKADASLARQVRAFHLKFGHPIANFPGVPAEAVVRFRLKLIAEEFVELIDAALDTRSDDGAEIGALERRMRGLIEHTPINVLLPEFVDAMADLAYVIEGTAAVFGVHMAPVVAEVQRANLDKDPNGPDGKPVKPADWTPPDVRGCLIAQGWAGP